MKLINCLMDDGSKIAMTIREAWRAVSVDAYSKRRLFYDVVYRGKCFWVAGEFNGKKFHFIELENDKSGQ